MPVNGAYYGWEDLTVLLPNGPQIDLTDIEYNSERELEHVYGQGSAPRGVGRGNWKGEGKLTMKREQYNLLVAYAMAAGKSIYTLSPFTITVAFMNMDQGLSTDQLIRCRFRKVGKSNSQNDKTSNVELEYLYEDQEEMGASQISGLNLL